MVWFRKGRLPLGQCWVPLGFPRPETPMALGCCWILALWWNKIRTRPNGRVQNGKGNLEMSC